MQLSSAIVGIGHQELEKNLLRSSQSFEPQPKTDGPLLMMHDSSAQLYQLVCRQVRLEADQLSYLSLSFRVEEAAFKADVANAGIVLARISLPSQHGRDRRVQFFSDAHSL